MRNLLAVAFVLLSWCSVVAADDRATAEAFVARYDRAYLARDTATLTAMLADDYRVFVEGKAYDRAASLARMLEDKKGHPSALTTTVDRVHASGDLAVAVGAIRWTAGDDSGSEQYTLVLRREAGIWRAIEEHISEVAQEQKP